LSRTLSGSGQQYTEKKGEGFDAAPKSNMEKQASLEETLLPRSQPEWKEEESLVASEEVKRQLWLAGPLIAGNLLQNLIPMISVMLVGHLGELPLAGASVANSFATVTGFSLMVRT
jgi:MATE family multidrug resistance protein